jgi:hypothetical protein
MSDEPQEHGDGQVGQVRFDATQGVLPPEARRALVSLLKQGVILASHKALLFEAVCRYQLQLRQHLADMYLGLSLDEKAGLAFIVQQGEAELNGDDEAVSLISRRTLSLYDTLLLLVLRKHYQERESTGEQRIIIDIERIEASLTPFLALGNSSRADRRKLDVALRKMIERRLLAVVRGDDSRFEITPVIRYVVNAEFLERLLADYQRLADEGGLATQGRRERQQSEEDEDQDDD